MAKCFPKIHKTLESFETHTIPEHRKPILNELFSHLQSKIDRGLPVRLNFICTHNSRRSHLAQIWAQTSATYFGFDTVQCYSGGTEATAIYPVIIDTLVTQGFEIKAIHKIDNPCYTIKYSPNALPVIGFSKTYNDLFNPQGEFTAVLTCTDADLNCPYVFGAENRIILPYEDPKISDGRSDQKIHYRDRSEEIASEMYAVFSRLRIKG